MFFSSRSRHLQLDWRSLSQKMNARKTLEEFIEIYKNEPCLWKTENKEYRNRQKKNEAYTRLVDKLKEIEPDADRALVVKKINNFRTAYRKELKRLRSAKATGEKHESKLWYFDRFQFLNYLEKRSAPLREDSESESTENNSNEPSNSDHQFNDAPAMAGPSTTIDGSGPSFSLDSIKTEVILPDDYDTSEQPHPSDATSTASTSAAVPAPPPPTEPITSIVVYPSWSATAAKKPKVELPAQSCNNAASTVATQGNSSSCVGEDRFEVFAKNVALKLREMDKTQRILVEKIINDALFEGEMGTLTLNHRLVNVSQQYNATFLPYPAV